MTYMSNFACKLNRMPLIIVQIRARNGQRLLECLTLDVELEIESTIL